MRNKYFKGQGLLETIVALGILTSGIFAVMSLVIGNLTTERAGTMRVQALNLAREGLEAVKNIRDSNWVAGDTTWNGIIDSDQTAQLTFGRNDGTITLDFTPNSIDEASVYQSDGVYLQGSEAVGGVKTPFSRLISIQPILCIEEEELNDKCVELGFISPDNAVGIIINSQVEWYEAGRRHELILREKLYDWR